MKLKNKILSAIMMIAACTTFVSVSALAASVSLTPSATEVKAGDTFTVEVSTVDNPGVYYLELKASADAGLTLTGVTDSKLYAGATLDKDYNKPVYTLAWWIDDLCENESTDSGLAATLTYTVAADAAPGEYTVTVAGGNSDNAAFEGVDFGTTTTTIKVVAGQEEVTTETRYYEADLAAADTATGFCFDVNNGTATATTKTFDFTTNVAEAESVTVGLEITEVPVEAVLTVFAKLVF